MDVRHTQMIAKLSEHGWRMAVREREDLDWWVDEIWIVQSEWAPQGFTLYLTWLVDPQWDDQRQPGQAVWAVGTCLERLAGRSEAEGSPLMSIKHWPRGVPEFLARLGVLRDNRRRTTQGLQSAKRRLVLSPKAAPRQHRLVGTYRTRLDGMSPETRARNSLPSQTTPKPLGLPRRCSPHTQVRAAGNCRPGLSLDGIVGHNAALENT
jgi:hypothetical protein